MSLLLFFRRRRISAGAIYSWPNRARVLAADGQVTIMAGSLVTLLTDEW